MRGRRTSDSAGAVSRSKGFDGIEGVGGLEDGSRRVLALGPLEPPDRSAPLDALDSLAESTAAICARSAACAPVAGALSGRDAREKRTPAPRSATAEKKQSALRSDGVTRERCASEECRRHPDVARRIVEFQHEAHRECKRLIRPPLFLLTSHPPFLTRSLPCARDC